MRVLGIVFKTLPMMCSYASFYNRYWLLRTKREAIEHVATSNKKFCKYVKARVLGFALKLFPSEKKATQMCINVYFGHGVQNFHVDVSLLKFLRLLLAAMWKTCSH